MGAVLGCLAVERCPDRVRSRPQGGTFGEQKQFGSTRRLARTEEVDPQKVDGALSDCRVLTGLLPRLFITPRVVLEQEQERIFVPRQGSFRVIRRLSGHGKGASRFFPEAEPGVMIADLPVNCGKLSGRRP